MNGDPTSAIYSQTDPIPRVRKLIITISHSPKRSKLKLPLLSYTDKLIDLFLEGIDMTPLKTNSLIGKSAFSIGSTSSNGGIFQPRYVSFRDGKPTFKYKDSRHQRWDDHLQYKELIHPKCCGNLGTKSRQNVKLPISTPSENHKSNWIISPETNDHLVVWYSN